MTFGRLLWRGVQHYWPTELAVTAGVAVAVAVLGGALVVGESVRSSLRSLALERLGHVDRAIVGRPFLRESFAADLATDPAVAGTGRRTAPVLVLDGIAEHETTGRRAAHVIVYGIDERFLALQGLDRRLPPPAAREALVTPALAAELGAAPGNGIVLTFDRLSSIPAGVLQGRREGNARTVRVTTRAILDDTAGEFALRPTQGAVRAVYVSLALLQRAVEAPARVNTILVSEPDRRAIARPARAPGEGSRAAPAGATAEIAAAVRRAAALDDMGLRVRESGQPPAVIVESESGFLSDALRDAAAAALRPESPTGDVVPVLTYLANEIRADGRVIPYSIVSAIDLADRRAAATATPPAIEPIWLNEWSTRDLSASIGDRVSLEYYVWSDARGLETRTATFVLAGTVPMDGPGGDRTLTPEYPGLTSRLRMTDWDPPFPVDLSRVRREDEDYWNRFQAAPKAFVPLRTGQRLWSSPYGSVTSLRLVPPRGIDPRAVADRVRGRLRDAIDPMVLSTISVVPTRDESLEAASGATDFGEYFVYFSIFLVFSGMLLAGLFFRLGIEQRLREIGLMRAVGIAEPTIRGLFLSEGAVLAAIGALLGTAGAVAYASGIMWALRTWWVDAVGTTRLVVRPDIGTLAIGALTGIAIAPLVIWFSLRHLVTASPRGLLAGEMSREAGPAGPQGSAATTARALVLALPALAVLVVVLGVLGVVSRVAAFFSAGGLLLTGALLLLSFVLRRPSGSTIDGAGTWPVARLGFRGAAHRPGRAALCVTLIAFATFTIVAVGAFRRGTPRAQSDPASGTGGYALAGESVLPIHHDPGSRAGRVALGLTASGGALDGVTVTRFRLRAGDDASCLNLYRPTRPRLLGAPDGFIAQARFSFARTLAESSEERKNPWLLLRRRYPDGAVPAVGDANSLAYVLHRQVGDDLVLDTGGSTSVRLRIVASLADSVLQSELIVSEAHFTRLFPSGDGYRVFLVDTGNAPPAEIAGVLERGLADYGLDLAPAADRLAAFHRVENTYLATFQTLGGLGLLLGTLGIGVVLFRNVLERRRELALLRAVGFDEGRISLLVVAEAALLVVFGAAVGAACALVAVLPALSERRGAIPIGWLAVLLASVMVTGLASSLAAAWAARRFSLVSSLRTE